MCNNCDKEDTLNRLEENLINLDYNLDDLLADLEDARIERHALGKRIDELSDRIDNIISTIK